ncbi:MAG TPA: DUF2339 domain-containing protein [Bacteroidota bacterium]|nr:DUF2339 domain-containing protein [Bacteroidota bacterium]
MILLVICVFVLLIVLVVLALSQVSDLNKRITAYLRELNKIVGLESRLERLEREMSGLRSPAGGATAQPGPPGGTIPTRAGLEPGGVTSSAPPAAPPAAIPSRGPESPVAPITPWETRQKKPSRSRPEWEAFIGGKLLNRIGAFALILGVGFFLKYAFDNNLISETVRVLIGAAAGFTCLAVARRTHRRDMKIFGQGLVGSGIAILYLSVYASFNYYHLVPQWLAFVMMSVVTLLTFWHGILYDSLAVGVLGWAGGFITPFMLSTGEPNETGLFGYIALLDAAILGVVFRKRSWVVLEPLTLLATWAIYYRWHIDYYVPDKLPAALLFISLFWMFFHAADAVRNLRPSNLWPGVRHLLPTVNAGMFYLMLYAILEEGHHGWTAPVTLLVAALYFGTETVMRGRDPQTDTSRPQNLLTVAALVGVATAVQYSGYTTVMLWSLEAVILAWCSIRWNLQYLMVAGLLFFMATAMKFSDTPGAFHYAYLGETDPVFNLRNLAYLVYSLALAAGARQFRKSADRSARLVRAWLESAAAGVLFIGVTITVNDIFSFRQSIEPTGAGHDLLFVRLMAIACTWTVYSLPVVWFGLKSGKNTVLIPGLAALLLAVALVAIRGIAFSPIESFVPFFNFRVASFLLVLLAMVIHSTLIGSHREVNHWLPDVRNYLGMAMGVMVFSLLTGETRDYFGKLLEDLGGPGGAGRDPEKVTQFLNLRQLSLSGVWLLYSGVLLAAGIWKASKGLRFFSIGLFGLTILKIFIYDLSFLETLYRIFSFVGLGLILLAVSYAYQRYKHILFGEQTGEGSPPPGG